MEEQIANVVEAVHQVVLALVDLFRWSRGDAGS